MTGKVVVRASIAPMHAESRVSSPQISQRLAGHAVEVLEMAGDWLRVRGEDGYEGWMHRGYVFDDGREPSQEPEKRRLSLGCVARDGATGSSRALPLGAWLAAAEVVVTGSATGGQDRVAAFPRNAAAIADTAVERFAGTPYQWGGVSPWGADCSGLTQTTFWLHGVSLPRDAWQQADMGDDAGTDTESWSPADLLFFSDRPDKRITHVGISLGESRMVHLALGRGGYAVERLDATDDPYVAALMARFVGAKRISL
jgi:gamma-D-glutamyl-L-lysine dipeptidyl-peptidase